MREVTIVMMNGILHHIEVPSGVEITIFDDFTHDPDDENVELEDGESYRKRTFSAKPVTYTCPYCGHQETVSDREDWEDESPRCYECNGCEEGGEMDAYCD